MLVARLRKVAKIVLSVALIWGLSKLHIWIKAKNEIPFIAFTC